MSCKDCGSVTRKVTRPGPRCATCHRARKAALKAAAHARWVEKTYGITGEQYETLYRAQGGVCYLCKRATGKSKRLAVDHDHKTGYVRGLLCGPCNSVLAQARDDVLYFHRAIAYLTAPPAQMTIGKVKPSE